MPFVCLANDNGLTINKLMSNGISILEYAWNHKVFAMDNQPVTIANIIIAIVSLTIGLRLARYVSTLFKAKLFTLINLVRIPVT